MQLSDAASIATIVSAVIVLAAFVVAALAAKFAWQSVVEGREAGELSKQIAELQRQNLETAERISKAASDSVMATTDLHWTQHLLAELSRYEYLYNCVTRIEAMTRSPTSHLEFNDARNAFQDALDLFPTLELTRCRELCQTRINTAGNFTDNAKNELSAIIREYRKDLQRRSDLLNNDSYTRAVRMFGEVPR